MATWSNIGSGRRKKTVRVRRGSRVGLHFGSQIGAKLEPNAVKMACEIASKFEVDFEMAFGSNKVLKGRQNGSQSGAKMESKSFSEVSGSKKATNVRIVLWP